MRQNGNPGSLRAGWFKQYLLDWLNTFQCKWPATPCKWLWLVYVVRQFNVVFGEY